jgi:hypothetical protein
LWIRSRRKRGCGHGRAGTATPPLPPVAVFWLPAPAGNRSGATRHASPNAIGKTALWCGSYYPRKLRRKQPAVGAGIVPNSNRTRLIPPRFRMKWEGWLGQHFFNRKLFSATINKVSLCAKMRLPFKEIVSCWSENGIEFRLSF